MKISHSLSSEKSQFERSLTDVMETFQMLPPFQQRLEQAAELVTAALMNGHKLMFCGNGGSASDTAHIANEFTCRFCEDRRPYPAMSFAVDGGLLSAIGNDYHFDDLFARQVLAFGKKGDVFIGLSSSGNSRNVLKALEQAKALGITTIALLGKTGGFTVGVADVEIIVPGKVTARIQEAQKFLLHVLCEIVEARLPR